MRTYFWQQPKSIVRAIMALLFVIAVVAPASAHAVGTASLGFGDLGDGYGVGDVVAVPIEETGDGVTGASATLTYPQSLLQFDETYLGDDFDPASGGSGCTQNSGGGGTVSVSCTTSVGPQGTDMLALAYFTVLTPGTVTFRMTSGDITDGSGSIWDGRLPSATLTVYPESNYGTGTGSDSGTSSTGGTSTTNATTDTSTATTSATAVTSANGKKLNLQAGKGAALITAVDEGGQPLLGAKITLDGQKIGYTDNTGEFEFINLAPGQHTISASRKGKVDTQETFTITEGKESQVKAHLNAAPVSLFIGYIALGILSIPLLVWLYERIPIRFQVFSKHSIHHMSDIVVGSDLQAARRTDTGQAPMPMAQQAEAAHIAPPLPPVDSVPQTVLNPQSLPVPDDPKKRQFPWK